MTLVVRSRSSPLQTSDRIWYLTADVVYYFRKGKNAVLARKKLYNVYGKKSFTERQRQDWFVRFRSGDFDLKDAPRSGRPTEVDDDKIKATLENKRCSATR